jgi:hypothetical protein
MSTDPVYTALYPFHQWAQIAAVCALLLALASFAVLALSRRLSRRWWLGLGILTLCLLVVAFGERSRSASADLRPIVVGCVPTPTSGCDVWLSWVTDAQQRVAGLGVLALACTALGIIIAGLALLRMRRSAAEGPHCSPVALGLPIGIFATGYGVAQTAESAARWIETTKIYPGDGLGLLPEYYAIVGTTVGVAVTVVGLLAVIACTPPRRERAAYSTPE